MNIWGLFGTIILVSMMLGGSGYLISLIWKDSGKKPALIMAGLFILLFLATFFLVIGDVD